MKKQYVIFGGIGLILVIGFTEKYLGGNITPDDVANAARWNITAENYKRIQQAADVADSICRDAVVSRARLGASASFIPDFSYSALNGKFLVIYGHRDISVKNVFNSEEKVDYACRFATDDLSRSGMEASLEVLRVGGG
jgi:hypothetical protein